MKVHLQDILFNITGIRTVFTTLVHSLWLGAVMALIAAIIIMLTKKSGPQLRYKLLTALLILFIISILCVFYNVLNNEINTAKNNSALMATPKTVIQQPGNIQEQNGVMETLISFIETHADIIVFIWFVVICFKCMQLVSGLYNVYRLKKRNVMEAGTYWNKRMQQLAAKISISKPVVLLQSSLAKVPMVIGHLKPVILFPVGILNALPANEVEAILLHELAHIKRNDFLTNLLQQFAEIFFFFNPSVLWILSLIKTERENCCDDIAIAVTHDKKIFIHALVTFQEYNAGVPYAATFHGSKNHLLNRVKRIITNNNKTLNNMEKLILASGIILTCLATVAFSPAGAKDKKTLRKGVELITQNAEADTTIKTSETKYQGADYFAMAKYTNNNDTVPEKEKISDSGYNINFNGDVDGKRIRLKEENSKIKELYIDGKKISEDQYDQYKPLIDKIHLQMKEYAAQMEKNAEQLKQNKEEMKKQAAIMQKEAEKMKEQTIIMEKDFKDKEELMKRQQVEMQKQAELMNKNDSATKKQAIKMKADFMKQMEQFKIKQVEFQKKVEQLKLQQQQLKEMIKDSIQIKSGAWQQPAIYTKPVLSVKPSVSVHSTTFAKPVTTVAVTNNLNTREVVSVVHNVVNKPTPAIVAKPAVYHASTSISEDIIRELEDANIIKTRNNLSFRFTNDELIVNGIKQPDALHQRLLKKYITKPGETISISYSNQQ
jgi:bla regulator protein BlaR1